ncbi:P-loop NTPase family protein [Aquimarina sediminis]|uniref:ATP-binding protein n=1 Tax=Aquimarina sediminis TaxID=2070536 RepID=UPI000CA0357D|nr:ATP-binding protein [Aquimarina sediminis]
MSAIIRNIHIPIQKYNLSTHCDENSIFIGREVAREKLRRRITPNDASKIYKGAYLVAGYRGMGKSTLVDTVIKEEVNHIENHKVIPVEIFLSQGELTDYDLLRQIFIQFSEKVGLIHKNPFDDIVIQRVLAGILSLLVCFFIVFGLLYSVASGVINIENQTLITDNHLLMVLLFSLLFILTFFILNGILSWFYLEVYHKEKSRLFSKIDQVYKRINSNLEIQSQTNETETFKGFSGGPILSKTISFVQNSEAQPYKQSFNKYTAKELEFEIKEVLRLYQKFRKKKTPDIGYVLFIIDELDKLEPEFVEGNTNHFALGKSRLDVRKETLSRLLANLKSFIHTADAKFIFIGGAEMYDASLADIADRESFYSSIFHEVIYVNSFFKDYENRKTGITQMAENYLVRIIMGNDVVDDILRKKRESISDNTSKEGMGIDPYDYLKIFYDSLKEVEEKDLIFQQIHKFIVYLTYRSNGSPKKLKELIENYLNVLNPKESDEKRNLFLDRKDTDFKNRDNRLIPEQLFLSLRYKEQHKIGVLSSIFFPYLIDNEKYLKDLNDKNLYLSAFLMDHILKFHRSAFSWRELELMPDIIIGSKGPNLRTTLKDLISYLSVKHIRRTTNAMFQFKFRSRSAMELKYISKVSDESAAAFNFTLDESYHIKAFFKRKLKQKMELYKNGEISYNNSSFIHTLGYLNSTIADIHFYDEDYDSAIRYYADAIQPLRDREHLNQHQMMLYTRNRLLLSLCLEKSNRYDSTYSILRSITLDTREWNFDIDKEILYYKEDTEWESPYKRMQLFLRPHLALLMILEKDRSDGITESNLERNIQEYAKFMNIKKLFPFAPYDCNLKYRDFFQDNIIGDHKRVQTLLADYYQSVGTLLFYKNRNYKSLYEKGAHGILYGFLGLKGLKERTIKNREVFVFDKKIKNPMNYVSLDNVRTHYGRKNAKHYYPSFSAFFYYTTSLGHLLSPYVENIRSIFINDKGIKNLNSKNQILILQKLVFENRSKHILNGKQKQFLGLVLGKLSDSILSCLGKIKLNSNKIGDIIKSKDVTKVELRDLNAQFWGLQKSNNKLDFDTFFSVENVFYFNILSYRLYYQAGKYHDALFYIKKCLYIIKTNLLKNKSNSKIKLNFMTILNNESDKVLSNYTSWIKRQEIFYKQITNTENLSDDIMTQQGLIVEDKGEINLICQKIDFHLRPSDTKQNLNTILEESTIDSIFSRLQFLRHKIDSHFVKRMKFLKLMLAHNGEFNSDVVNKYIKTCIQEFTENTTVEKEHIEVYKNELKGELINVDFCGRNLINIIKTYGFNYIMSYSYIGSLYYNLIYWSYAVVKLKEIDSSFEEAYDHWGFKDVSHLKNEGIKYYKKAIRMHSEGSEYKSSIKEMYILEDDLNDSLVHFCGALERSLINTGVIEMNIKKIQDLKSF